MARTTLLAQWNKDYTRVAQQLGASRRAVLTRHVLPFAVDAIRVQLITAGVAAVLMLVAAAASVVMLKRD